MTQIIGHRGAKGSAPENTIAGFRHAVALGIDGVELDVRRTSDRQLVVHHDPVLPDGRAIVDLRRSDLPASVPTLAAALNVLSPVAVNIEIKNNPGEPDYDPSHAIVDEVIATLRRTGAIMRRWLVSSFNRQTLQRVRSVEAAVRTAPLADRFEVAELGAIANEGHSAIHPGVGCVDEPLIAESHRLGLAVNVWTVNADDDVERLLAWGVDGIVTDWPQRALRRRRGR